MRAADVRPADMRAANMRPADMGRPEPTAAASAEAYSAAVPAKPAAMSAKACEVSAATMSASTATMPAASAAPGVGFECEKRHDEEQYRGYASASRQHYPHGAAGLDAPQRRGRLGLGIPPRTTSF